MGVFSKLDTLEIGNLSRVLLMFFLVSEIYPGIHVCPNIPPHSSWYHIELLGEGGEGPWGLSLTVIYVEASVEDTQTYPASS